MLVKSEWLGAAYVKYLKWGDAIGSRNRSGEALRTARAAQDKNNAAGFPKRTELLPLK